MRGARFVVVMAVVGAVVFGAGTPAYAGTASESGFQRCSPSLGELAAMVARGRLGTLKTIGPGDTTQISWGYQATWTSREDIQSHSGNGGYWVGSVEGTNPDLDEAATGGYCIY